MAFPATYPIKPIHPSPVLTWTNGVMTAVRQFAIPCENVAEFVYDMLTGDPNTLGFPATFPDFPNVFVETINVEPICAACMTSPDGQGVIENPITELEGYPSGAAGSQELNGCECHVTVNYNTRNFQTGQDGVREGTFITYERDAAAEYITYPTRSMFWQEPNGSKGSRLPPDHRDAVMIAVGDITITWHFVDEVDLCFTEANLRLMQGRVNANYYGGVFFPGVCVDVFPPETLLFMGYSTSLDLTGRSVFGSYGTTVEKKRTLKLHFKYREVHSFCTDNNAGVIVGWNHGLDDRAYLGSDCSFSASDPCEGFKRVIDSCGNPRYPLISFANMFL